MWQKYLVFFVEQFTPPPLPVPSLCTNVGKFHINNKRGPNQVMEQSFILQWWESSLWDYGLRFWGFTRCSGQAGLGYSVRLNDIWTTWSACQCWNSRAENHWHRQECITIHLRDMRQSHMPFIFKHIQTLRNNRTGTVMPYVENRDRTCRLQI